LPRRNLGEGGVTDHATSNIKHRTSDISGAAAKPAFLGGSFGYARPMMSSPQQLVREKIDSLLAQCGW